jgi:hypothetical protein
VQCRKTYLGGRNGLHGENVDLGVNSVGSADLGSDEVGSSELEDGLGKDILLSEETLIGHVASGATGNEVEDLLLRAESRR